MSPEARRKIPSPGRNGTPPREKDNQPPKPPAALVRRERCTGRRVRRVERSLTQFVQKHTERQPDCDPWLDSRADPSSALQTGGCFGSLLRRRLSTSPTLSGIS